MTLDEYEATHEYLGGPKAAEFEKKLIKLARAVDEIDDSTLCDLGLYFLREEVFGDDV